MRWETDSTMPHPVEKCNCPICMTVKNKIREGDKFVCTDDVVMDDGKVAYKSGKIYTSEREDCITNEQGETFHSWEYEFIGDDKWQDYFQRYEEKHCCNPCDCSTYRGKDYFDSVREENPYKPDSTYEGTELLISRECNALKELLIEKNRAYGDSALKNGVLFDISPVEAIKARINDKAMRIKNVGLNDSTEDTLQDIMGYMVLLRIAIRNERTNQV